MTLQNLGSMSHATDQAELRSASSSTSSKRRNSNL